MRKRIKKVVYKVFGDLNKIKTDCVTVDEAVVACRTFNHLPIARKLVYITG